LSNHFSAANLKSPGDDARLDLTDLFVFAAPDNPGRTVLIMNSNRTRPAHYPNGRVMTDDVFSARMIFMVHGEGTPNASDHTRI
jgi:hypothetical protein